MPWRSVLQPSLLLSTITLSFLALVRSKSQKARYYINLSLYIGSMLATSFCALGIAVLLSLAGKRLNTNFVVGRLFYLMAAPLTGVHLKLEGAEHLDNIKGPAIIIGNHQSFLDILYLGKMFPKRASIMAKKELAWTPFLGWWMSLSGAVWIDRKRSKNALQVMAKAGDDMKKKGVSLFIFPEGTRTSSATPLLLPFKKGAFHLAIDAQVPIIPVVCENYHHLFDGKTRLDGGTLTLRILPPILTTSLTADDVTSLAESTRQTMLSTLLEISTSAPPPRPPTAVSSSSSSEETQPLLSTASASASSSIVDTTTTTNSSSSYGTTTTAAAAVDGSQSMDGEEKALGEDESDGEGAVIVPRGGGGGEERS